jgi:hypothetical protein
MNKKEGRRTKRAVQIRPVLSMYFLPSFRPYFLPSFGLYLYTYPIEKTVFHVFSRLLTEQK